jgi:hypothetical protein
MIELTSKLSSVVSHVNQQSFDLNQSTDCDTALFVAGKERMATDPIQQPACHCPLSAEMQDTNSVLCPKGLGCKNAKTQS